MILKLFEENPRQKHIETVVDSLKNGGVIIYPTDTVYSIGCDIYQHKAVEKVAQIKGIKPKEANFSFIFSDIDQIAEFTKPFSTTVFKLMKKAFPGPFTFILNANSKVPKIFHSKKKTIGVRIPDNTICRTIVRELGNPVLSTSVYDDDEVLEYSTDPELIHEKYNNVVDYVVNGGYGENEASTIVDCTGDQIEIVRQGLGIIDGYA